GEEKMDVQSGRNAAFLALTNGARFHKKRFEKDIEKFSEKANTPTSHSNLQNKQMKKLNFFDDAAVSETATEASTEAEKDGDNTSPIAKQFPKPGKNKASALRKKHGIKAAGTDMPPLASTFSELVSWYNIPDYISRNVLQRGISTPTPIQMQGLPCLLEGRDFIGVAPTGSGKTLAFLLPMLVRLRKPKASGLRGLVIAHSKELAAQSERELRYLSKGARWGVQTMSTSKASVAKMDILCSTPGRLQSFVADQQLPLSTVEYIVFDEADQLFDTSHDTFFDTMKSILAACGREPLCKVASTSAEESGTNAKKKKKKKKKQEKKETAANKCATQEEATDDVTKAANDKQSKTQIAILCATLPEKAEGVIRSFVSDPCRVMIGTRASASYNVLQKLEYCGKESGKMQALQQMLLRGLEPPVLIFVQSIDRAKDLYTELLTRGQQVAAIHSERTAAQRDATIRDFRTAKLNILVCTELLARGIDFKGVQTVINYDFPTSIQSYVHRVGRTGRAGRTGTAITLWADDDRPNLRSIANIVRSAHGEVPDWMLEVPVYGKKKPNRQKHTVSDAANDHEANDSLSEKKHQEQAKIMPPHREAISAVRRVREAEENHVKFIKRKRDTSASQITKRVKSAQS
ncbi:putative ATP-dependent RNA helicase ddx52, partial [Diplonema papillatum]